MRNVIGVLVLLVLWFTIVALFGALAGWATP